MVSAHEHSPLTGEPVPSHYLHASSAFFRDTAGRAVFLRGVNFSASAKAPLHQPTQQLQDFWHSAEAGGKSFVGQPLNLDDGSADTHLSRLRLWGFNCLRYVFTWEALEHQGPGKYDRAYIAYVVAVLRKCKEYGFRVYMDPHQDVFSRFTGGSGAPYWVLPACGIDHRGLTPTQAAFLHSEWPSKKSPDPASFPDMLWATGYTRLAPATLSVLFFAGHHYAPKCRIDGKPISHWLQDHFIAACRELAVAIHTAGDLCDDCVIGWDSLNEPNPTYVGLQDLTKMPAHWQLKQGPMPTPAQSLALGVGKSQRVQHWTFSSLGPKRDGDVTVDPQGTSVWLSAEEDAHRGGDKWGWKRDESWPLGQCVWAAHDVWDVGTGKVNQPDYFRWYRGESDQNQRRQVDFVADYWLPFWRRYAAAIRPVHKEAIMFVQPPVFEPPPAGMSPTEDLQNRACVSCHFYDGLTLVTKHWNWYNADAIGLLRGKYAALVFALRFGAKAVRKVMRDQLGYLRADTLDVLGQFPTLIGEIGIPFDLDNKRSYFGDATGKGKGDYSSQSKALDASLNGCDGTNLLSYTLWTYCPDNTHAWGDGWNGEDLSVWSLDDASNTEQIQAEAMSRQGSSATLSDQQKPLSKKTSAQESVIIRSLSKDDEPQRVRRSILVPPSVLPLVNGTRAAPAFYRPYPIATAGKPISIDFDIPSATFRLVLELDGDDGFPYNGEPTEIFVPLVHYAQDDGLAGLMAGASTISSSYESSEEVVVADTQSYQDQQHQQVSDSTKGSDTTTWGNWHVEDPALPPLALDVQVSSGKWSVQGQVLKWWPESAVAQQSGKGSQSRQEITIRRQGGPIKAVVAAHTGASVASSLGLMQGCFAACADACVIM